MNKQNELAVIVFAFNRPTVLSKTLCNLEKISKSSAYKFVVYVNVDGPKNKSDLDKQKDIRRLADLFPDYKFSFKNMNRGLSQSILTGVDEAARLHKNILVLEDDILLLKNIDPVIDIWMNRKISELYTGISLYSPFGVTWRNVFRRSHFLET